MRATAVATAVGGLALHLAVESPSQIALWTEWFLNRPFFFLSFYTVTFLAGTNLVLVGPRWRHQAEPARRMGDWLAAAYSGLAGGVMGWTIGVCAIAIASDARWTGISIMIVLTMAGVALAPLCSHTMSRLLAHSLCRRLHVAQWRILLVQSVGWLQMTVSVAGLFLDLEILQSL